MTTAELSFYREWILTLIKLTEPHMLMLIQSEQKLLVHRWPTLSCSSCTHPSASESAGFMKIIQSACTCVHVWFLVLMISGDAAASREKITTALSTSCQGPIFIKSPRTVEPGRERGGARTESGVFSYWRRLEGRRRQFLLPPLEGWPDRVLKPGSRGLCRFNDLFFPRNQILHLNCY